MSDSVRIADGDTDRLLSFEVEGTVYALPITAVLEVAESNRANVVPGLASEIAAAMNWHGEALPLLASPLLLEEEVLEEEALEEEVLEEELMAEEAAEESVAADDPEEGPDVDDPWAAAGLCRSEEARAALPSQSRGEAIAREHVLVVAGRSDEAPSLGMPVDRVLGLVEGAVTPDPEAGMVMERRPVDGRVVNILDPQCLVARAAGLIERAAV